MSSRPALRAALSAILATQPACVGELQERCPLLSENRPAPALPHDVVRLDDLLRHRTLQMWHDARQLNGSATRSFRIYFGEETLPLACASGGPPVPPLPALGVGAAAMELSGATYIELAEAIRKLVASGALDAGVVAALSATTEGRSAPSPSAANGVQMSAAHPDPPQTKPEAPSSLKGAQLQEYLRQVEQYGSGGVKVLENGRIRFYGQLTPARTPGEMAGARVVREWDPSTGAKRTWIETLDQRGTVRSIRPETGDPKIHQIFDANGNDVGPR